MRIVQERAPVVITVTDSNSASIQPLKNLGANDKTLSLWNRSLLPNLERTWISNPGYYRVDGLRTPTLEFVPSFNGTWEGRPALGQGRLFGDFDAYLAKPPEYEKWFESLVCWMRKKYRKNPAGIGGYVGQGAYEFYEGGGYLLPNFLPPRTKVWLDKISKQHSADNASANP